MSRVCRCTLWLWLRLWPRLWFRPWLRFRPRPRRSPLLSIRLPWRKGTQCIHQGGCDQAEQGHPAAVASLQWHGHPRLTADWPCACDWKVALGDWPLPHESRHSLGTKTCRATSQTARAHSVTHWLHCSNSVRQNWTPSCVRR